MLNKFKNRQSWIESLYNEINEEFNKTNNLDTYSKELPYYLNIIKNNKDFPSYGNPIEWCLSGVSGVNAFIVGDVFENSDLLEDLSEKNFFPPLLTKELNALGEEYMYSQIAIVLTGENIDKKTRSWLNQWRDDPRYFRKILVSITVNDAPKDISRKITETFLSPWNSIKSLELDEGIMEVFEKVEEDEE